MRLPYFDTLLALLDRDNTALDRAFGRHVHWGYWPEPGTADGSPEDFEAAAEALAREVIRAGGVTGGMAVLDAGCGFGGTVASMNQIETGLRLTGLNIDHRQLLRASGRWAPRPGNHMQWVQADACALPLADSSVDAVLAVESIFHFPSRERFFREAFRVLKPGGRLAISDFVPVAPLAPFLRLISAGSALTGFYGHCRLYHTVADYRRLAAQTGFGLDVDRDITAQTLPSYDFLRGLARDIGWTGGSAAVETWFAEWASRAGGLRYRIFGFQKPAR